MIDHPSPLARQVASALRWPSFLYSVGVLYWSVGMAGLQYRIRWLDFRGRRNDVMAW
jgi:hypothetical protein